MGKLLLTANLPRYMLKRPVDFRHDWQYKGILLSKALTCMKFFLYKQKRLFIKETDIFGHIVVWTIYTSHIDHFTPPTYSFWTIGSILISLPWVTSWFDTVCNIVTPWVNFRENICMNINNNNTTTIYWSIFAQMYTFLVEKYSFTIFCLCIFHGKNKQNVNNTRNTYIWVNILLYIVCHNIANGIEQGSDSKTTVSMLLSAQKLRAGA